MNRACIFDGFELFRVGNRTRADDGVGHFFGNQADGVEADGGAQGDFEGGDTAFDKGMGQIDGGAQVVNRHHRHDCAGSQDFAWGQFGHFDSPGGMGLSFLLRQGLYFGERCKIVEVDFLSAFIAIVL